MRGQSGPKGVTDTGHGSRPKKLHLRKKTLVSLATSSALSPEVTWGRHRFSLTEGIQFNARMAAYDGGRRKVKAGFGSIGANRLFILSQ